MPIYRGFPVTRFDYQMVPVSLRSPLLLIMYAMYLYRWRRCRYRHPQVCENGDLNRSCLKGSCTHSSKNHTCLDKCSEHFTNLKRLQNWGHSPPSPDKNIASGTQRCWSLLCKFAPNWRLWILRPSVTKCSYTNQPFQGDFPRQKTLLYLKMIDLASANHRENEVLNQWIEWRFPVPAQIFRYQIIKSRHIMIRPWTFRAFSRHLKVPFFRQQGAPWIWIRPASPVWPRTWSVASHDGAPVR